jgi:glutathione peroxidase
MQAVKNFVYNIILFMGKAFGVNSNKKINIQGVKNKQAAPLESIILNNGKPIDKSKLENKKILIVNTASGCGYTPQYTQLQALQNQHPQLLVIAFPANDFKNQETKNDTEIAAFCSINYGVKFPITQKTSTQGQAIHPMYAWLTNADKNGWNTQAPQWNFSKYLLNEEGVLLGYFGSGVNPLDKSITSLL